MDQQNKGQPKACASPATTEKEPLSVHEKKCLETCERILSRGLNTFFEVGKALLTIRDDRLYRFQYSTFEIYCRERWGIGRSYAWRLIGAAERLRLLSPEIAQKPSNEFQIRPFLKLEPKLFPDAWEQALARAKDGRITSEIARKLVVEMSAQPIAKNAKPRGSLHVSLPAGCSRGQLLILLREAKHEIEKGNSENAIAAITRADDLLLGL